MRCAYCHAPVLRRERSEWRGQHQVHCGCQRFYEYRGLPHLLSGGEMRYHDHILPVEAANAMLKLSARFERERKKLTPA